MGAMRDVGFISNSSLEKNLMVLGTIHAEEPEKIHTQFIYKSLVTCLILTWWSKAILPGIKLIRIFFPWK